MNNKYELSQETIEVDGHTLYRIRAIRDFFNVKAGDLGGYIESEDNLSFTAGTCWVYDNAIVYENARVYGGARVYGSAMIYENAQVYRFARVFGHARVYGDARVGDAWIGGDVRVSGDTWIGDPLGDPLHFASNVWLDGDVNITSGIWNRLLTMGRKPYLVSTTLNKVLMGYK